MSDLDEEELSAHSERGPSTAHRWRPCPASVRLSRGIPNTAGIEAARGTVFHEFAAICLEQRLDPQGFVGAVMTVEPFGQVIFDQAMADNMLAGLDLARSFMDIPGAVTLVERRVSLENWVGKGEFGTTDLAIIDVMNKRLIVFDWKYGAGVPVDPTMNDQAILYTLGTWSDHAAGMFYDAFMEEAEAQGRLFTGEEPWEDSIEVIIIIEQPRAQGGGGVWKTNMGVLLAEGQKIRRDAKRTEDPDAPVVPGTKQCQFCPAGKALACAEKPKFLLKLAGADFDELESDFKLGSAPEIASAFTPEQRTQLLLHKPLFDKMFEDLHQQAYHDAEVGRPVPGMKLVTGRAAARSWKDDAKMEPILKAAFGAKAYAPAKLLSPTQIEETVGRKDFEVRFKRHVKEGERKSILVPATDKREALKSRAADFTDDMSDDETAIV